MHAYERIAWLNQGTHPVQEHHGGQPLGGLARGRLVQLVVRAAPRELHEAPARLVVELLAHRDGREGVGRVARQLQRAAQEDWWEMAWMKVGREPVDAMKAFGLLPFCRSSSHAPASPTTSSVHAWPSSPLLLAPSFFPRCVPLLLLEPRAASWGKTMSVDQCAGKHMESVSDPFGRTHLLRRRPHLRPAIV